MSGNNLSSVCEIQRYTYIKIHILRSPAAILDFDSHVIYE